LSRASSAGFSEEANDISVGETLFLYVHKDLNKSGPIRNEEEMETVPPVDTGASWYKLYVLKNKTIYSKNTARAQNTLIFQWNLSQNINLKLISQSKPETTNRQGSVGLSEACFQFLGSISSLCLGLF
jgi:hypothetical protein